MKTPNSKTVSPLSNKTIVPEEKLTDITSRLFRRLAVLLGADSLAIWKSYLDDYIRGLCPDDVTRMEAVKKERSTAIGNINDTFWMSTKLSFNKMITGLKILKIRKVTVTIKVETTSGKEYVVEETTKIMDE